jgi:hypothetical protein
MTPHPTKISDHAIDRYIERWRHADCTPEQIERAKADRYTRAICEGMLKVLARHARHAADEDGNDQSFWWMGEMLATVDGAGVVRTIHPKGTVLR